MSLFYDEQVPLGERRRLFQDLVQPPGPDQDPSRPSCCCNPCLPRAAANRHFGRLLAPVIDYFVEVESREGHASEPPGSSGGPGAPRASYGRALTPPLPTSKRRPLTWTYFYPSAHTCIPDLKFTARTEAVEPSPGHPGGRHDLSPGNPEIPGNPGADPGNRRDHADGGVDEK